MAPLPVSSAAAGTIPVAYSPSLSADLLPSPSSHPTIGYLTQLQLGSLTLTADFQVFCPKTLRTTMTVTAPLTSVQWDGAATSPLKFTAYVSQENEAAIRQYLSTHLTRPAVKLGFEVLAWNSATSAYGTTFGPATSPISTLVELSSGAPVIQVATTGTPATDGVDVDVYQLTLLVSAPTAAAVLDEGIAPTVKALTWGPNPSGL